MTATLKRRDLLRALAALPLGAAACTPEPPARREPPRAVEGRTPVLFVAHGAPVLLDDAAWVAELSGWAKALPKPKAILVVSAHWDARPTTLGATRTVPLVRDFSGFPQRYYETQYPAPGAPALASRVRELLAARGLPSADDAERGLDHGAYVPLMAMYPTGDIPVLQISLPGLIEARLLELGATLAPLRDEGVLIVGSGFLTHNMHYAFKPGTETWASEFDAWAADALQRFDVDAMQDFRTKAPGAKLALPTWEHYAPLLVAAGSASGGVPRVSFPITGWWLGGSFSKRSVQLA